MANRLIALQADKVIVADDHPLFRTAIKEALRKFLGPDQALFARWMDVLAFAFKGRSINDIERVLRLQVENT